MTHTGAFITKLEPLVRKPQETGPLLWSAEQWGIVRYAAGSGSTPEHDIAAFDGWYADREMATAVYHDWSERYPNLVRCARARPESPVGVAMSEIERLQKQCEGFAHALPARLGRVPLRRRRQVDQMMPGYF